MNQSCKIAIWAYVISFVAIVISGVYNAITHSDIFGDTVFESKWLGKLCGEEGVYSVYPCTHFLLYVIIGFFCPQYWVFWIILGIIWELIELAIGTAVRVMPKLDVKTVLSKLSKSEDENKTQYQKEWLTGKTSDIIFNVSGLITGIVAQAIVNRVMQT